MLEHDLGLFAHKRLWYLITKVKCLNVVFRLRIILDNYKYVVSYSTTTVLNSR